MVRFTTKKIDSLTLGEKMKKFRNERRLSLADVSRSTKIQAKYLEYIEEGEYMKLPADVYVKGFLRSFAIFACMNEAALIRQFEREKGIQKNIKKIVDIDENRKPIKFSSLVITPKMIAAIVVVILAIASFTYLYMEVNNFISEPRLVIIKPSDGSSTEETSTHVTGVAEKDSLIFINDQPVLVNENGEFSENVGLKSGLNVITVKARSKFNKEATKSVSVNANFQDSSEVSLENIPDGQDQNESQNGQQNPESISAEVFVNPNPTWLSVEADGNLVFSGVLLPQSMQTFEAKEALSITSSKGSETFVKINGKELGSISNDSGIARDVQYNAGGKVESIK